jgi:hypothetical protein
MAWLLTYLEVNCNFRELNHSTCVCQHILSIVLLPSWCHYDSIFPPRRRPDLIYSNTSLRPAFFPLNTCGTCPCLNSPYCLWSLAAFMWYIWNILFGAPEDLWEPELCLIPLCASTWASQKTKYQNWKFASRWSCPNLHFMGCERVGGRFGDLSKVTSWWMRSNSFIQQLIREPMSVFKNSKYFKNLVNTCLLIEWMIYWLYPWSGNSGLTVINVFSTNDYLSAITMSLFLISILSHKVNALFLLMSR